MQSAPFLGSAPDRAQRFGTCFSHKSPFDTNHAFLQRHRTFTREKNGSGPSGLVFVVGQHRPPPLPALHTPLPVCMCSIQHSLLFSLAWRSSSAQEARTLEAPPTWSVKSGCSGERGLAASESHLPHPPPLAFPGAPHAASPFNCMLYVCVSDRCAFH